MFIVINTITNIMNVILLFLSLLLLMLKKNLCLADLVCMTKNLKHFLKYHVMSAVLNFVDDLSSALCLFTLVPTSNNLSENLVINSKQDQVRLVSVCLA